MTALASVSDPDGRAVELTAERWEHILRRPEGGGHPELESHLAEVLRAIEAPVTSAGPDAGRTRSGTSSPVPGRADGYRWS